MASVREVTLVACLLAAASAFQVIQVMTSHTKRNCRLHIALCALRAACSVTSESAAYFTKLL